MNREFIPIILVRGVDDMGDDRHDEAQIRLKCHRYPFVLGVTPLITLIKKFASLTCS